MFGHLQEPEFHRVYIRDIQPTHSIESEGLVRIILQ